MSWDLSFISEQDFTRHVESTIRKYGDKLNSIDLEKFNKNIIDPIKFIFDKIVYGKSWDELIRNETFRQRDKANNNDIGYFHQRIFQYIDHCTVPDAGWDVIYKNPAGVSLPDGTIVHTVYVEMKNKHNTMNSAGAARTYSRMKDQLGMDDDSACFLVEAIAKQSQNEKWILTYNGRRHEHKLIRRVSLDKFYALVTGQDDAFYQVCMHLPDVVQNVVDNNVNLTVPQDTVMGELLRRAGKRDDVSLLKEIYLLGFPTYSGFKQ